jgi:hypothetical protein
MAEGRYATAFAMATAARLSSTELRDWEDGRGTPAGVRTDDAAEAGVPGLDVARRRSAESGVGRDVVVFRLGDVAGCLHRASMGLGVDAEPRRGGGIPSRVFSIEQPRCSVLDRPDSFEQERIRRRTGQGAED